MPVRELSAPAHIIATGPTADLAPDAVLYVEGAAWDGDGSAGVSRPQPTRVCSVSGPVVSALAFELERDYWLNRCVGFGVEAEGRLCGRVVLQKYRSRPDRPDALVVQSGQCPGRRFTLRAEDVHAIDPWLERVYVSQPPLRSLTTALQRRSTREHVDRWRRRCRSVDVSCDGRDASFSCCVEVSRARVPRSVGRVRR
jgi:hypothetical protein